MSGEFYSTYCNYLGRYMFQGAMEGLLLEAYEKLPYYLDDSEVQAANILDVHTRAFREVMGIRQDSDNVQWIYIVRATEFLAQILVVIDTFFLQLKERAERDHLTGLYNRLALYRLLPRMLKRAQEQEKPLVVAMLDLDDFKRINDQHGHQAGDEVLRFVAGVIKRSLRNDDLAVRFGGEEFVIVLPATDFTKAKIPLERIRAQIVAERMLPVGEGLTVSIGVAGYTGQGPVELNELIRQADEAMYRAKELGKNRVVFTQGDIGE